MSNYIVYKKETCRRCEGKLYVKIGDHDGIPCRVCKAQGTELIEVDLEEAMREIIKKTSLTVWPF